VIKVILAVFIILNYFSISFAGSLDDWKDWRSGRYFRAGTDYRTGDKTIQVIMSPGIKYEFKKSGKNSYKAYDAETGNLMEMKIIKDGLGEIHDYETEEDYLVILPEFGK